MAIYKAQKGNISFYIQPETLADYAALGYSIYKVEEVPIAGEDIEAEMKAAMEESMVTATSTAESVADTEEGNADG